MVYDTPTFVANNLRQSSLYNPTWNTQKHLIFSGNTDAAYSQVCRMLNSSKMNKIEHTYGMRL
jgi:glutamine amidotransferase-like uncharacterized protein